jgi:hypothetical protein
MKCLSQYHQDTLGYIIWPEFYMQGDACPVFKEIKLNDIY